MSEISEALSQLLNEMAEKLKANVPKVSNETAESIEVVIKDIDTGVSGSILAAKHIFALEDGRAPTRIGAKSNGKTLRESLLEWIESKSFTFPLKPKTTFGKAIKNAESLSWAMAISIHREGTLLYQNGGHSGVISNVINESRIETFLDVFNTKTARILLNDVLTKIKR